MAAPAAAPNDETRMQVTEISAEGLKREYRISVPAADIEGKLVARLNEVGQEVRVPGFRAGKVPLAVLRTRFGDAVRGEVLQSTIEDATSNAIEDEGVRPAMQPEIGDLKFEDGADLEYTLNLELMPEIEPVDFAALELERMVVRAEDEKVDEAIGRLGEQHRHFSPAEEGAEAKDGDEVAIDFVGSIDGEPFEGGAAEGFVLRLGSGQFVPGFEEQLLGAKAGEEKTVDIDFPEDYPNDELKGQGGKLRGHGQRAPQPRRDPGRRRPRQACRVRRPRFPQGDDPGPDRGRVRAYRARAAQTLSARQARRLAQLRAAARHGRAGVRDHLEPA